MNYEQGMMIFDLRGKVKHQKSSFVDSCSESKRNYEQGMMIFDLRTKKMTLQHKTILLFLLVLGTLVHTTMSQNQANIWYFGENAGLNFNNDTVVALTDGQITSNAAGSTISDKNGSLLFYTDGVTVWNANHDTMPNGTGLMGYNSGIQPAIIVPKPGCDSLFYIFTVGSPAPDNKLRYSIVNTNLDGGLGDLLPAYKNQILLDSSTARITASLHANGCDVWIFTHQWNTDAFYAFLLTSTDISLPVISNIGTIHTGYLGNSTGYIKLTPDGKKIGVAIFGEKLIEVFDVNAENGILSNPLTLTTYNTIPSGISFSYNYMLYVASQGIPGSSYQFDLTLGDSLAIQSSMYGMSFDDVGSFQLASDGKIYRSRKNKDFIGIIVNPNVYGIGSTYISNGIYLGGKICKSGLPNFIESYFNPIKPNFTFNTDTVCDGFPAAFEGIHPYEVISWNWNFGDPASAANTDTAQNPVHLFSGSGSYNVSLVIGGGCWSDTVIKTIYVKPNDLVVDIGNDTAFCYGSNVTLEVGNPGSSWLWSTGDTTQTLSVDSAGIYFVEVNDQGCTSSDTINIGSIPEIVVDLGNDTSICYGESIVLDAGNTGSSHTWSTGETTQTITTDSTGIYSVQVSNQGCSGYDTIAVFVNPEIVVNLGNDTLICYGDSVVLDAGNSTCSYLWSTSDTIQAISVTNAGLYYAEVTCMGCTVSDTIIITITPEIQVNLGNDTIICITDSIVLNAGNPGYAYSWSTGDTIQSITVNSSGLYSVEVSIYGCSGSDTLTVQQASVIMVNLGNDTSICVNESVILDAGNSGSEYFWSTGEASQTITVDSTGIYSVEVINVCIDSDTIVIDQYPQIDITISDNTTINYGTGVLLSCTGTGGENYNWYPANGLSCTNCRQTFAIPLETTTYTLEVTDSNNCVTNYEVTVQVNTTAVVFIPDIFSPNSDGLNDILYVRGQQIQSIQFQVYDRWGEKVFETTNMDIGWDGSFRGKPMVPAVFVYYITGNFENGDEIKMTGNVALVW